MTTTLVLTEEEMKYLRGLIGSDWVGRHADWSPYQKEAQKVWEKLK